MQSVDGDVRISVGLDTKSVSKNVSDLGRTVQSALNSANDVKGFDNLSVKAKQLEANVTKASNRVVELRKKIDAVANAKTPTKEYEALQSQLKSLESDFDKVANRQQELAEIGFKPEDSVFSQLEDEANSLGTQIDEITAKMKEMQESGTAYAIDTAKYDSLNAKLKEAESQYDIASQKVREFNEAQEETSKEGFKERFAKVASVVKTALSKAGSYLKSFAGVAKSAFSKVAGFAKSAFSKITSHAKSSGKSSALSITSINDTVKKGIKTLLRYGLGIRGTFMLFRKLRTAVKEGFQNLAQYSDEVNKDISGVMSAFTKFKNALTTMFQPLLKIVAPVLTTLINKASQVATSIGKIIAAFSGQDYIYEASDVQTDYAKSLDKTSESAKKAAKALDNYLSPLDDINKFQEASTDSDTDDGMIDTSKIFKMSAVESKFKDLATKLKNILKSSDWTSIGNMFGEKLNNILGKVDWKAIQKKAKTFATRLFTLINGFVASVNWNLVGNTISNGIKTALDFVLTFVRGLDFSAIGSAIGKIINRLLSPNNAAELANTASTFLSGILDALTSAVNTVDWGRVGKTIISLITSFKFSALSGGAMKLLNGFSGALGKLDFKQIGEAFRKGLSRINWKGLWRGVTNLFTNALQGLSDFFGLKGVNTSKLNTALKNLYTPIKNLYTTLKNTASELLKPIINDFLPSAVSLIGSIMDAAKPIIEAATPILKTVIEVVSQIVKYLAPAVSSIGGAIGKAVKALSPIIKPVLELIGNVVKFLAPAIEAIAGFVGTIADLISPITGFIGGIIGGISDIFGAFTGGGEPTVSEKLQAELDHLAGVSENLSTISGNIDEAISGVHSSIENTASDLGYIDNLKDRFDELMDKAVLSDKDMQEIQTIGDLLSDKLPGFQKAWQDIIGEDGLNKDTFVKNRKEMKESIDTVIDNLKNQYAVEALQDQYKELYKKKTEATKSYNDEIAKVTEAQKKYNDKCLEYNILQGQAEYFEKKYKDGDQSDYVQNQARKFRDKVNQTKTEVDEYKKSLDDASDKALKAAGKLGQADTELEQLSTTMNVLKTNGDGLKNSLQDLRTAFDNGLIDMDTVTKNTGLTAKEFFAKTKDLAKQSEAGFKKGVEESAESLRKDGVQIADSAINGAKEGFDSHSPSKKFIEIGENTIEGLMIGFEENMEKALDLVCVLAQRMTAAMQTGVQDIGNTFNVLPGMVKSALNNTLAVFENFLSRLTSGINSTFVQINQLNIAFAKSGKGGGTYTTWNPVSSIPIPRLAKGAVIPPNREFLAVLGDQSKGNNIEAPEGLIRDIIRDELNNSGRTGGNVYEVPLIVGRKTLAKLVIDEAKLMLSQTGKNPFELVTL